MQFWLLYVVVVCGSLDHSSTCGLYTVHSLSGSLQWFIALAELFIHVLAAILSVGATAGLLLFHVQHALQR